MSEKRKQKLSEITSGTTVALECPFKKNIFL